MKLNTMKLNVAMMLALLAAANAGKIERPDLDMTAKMLTTGAAKVLTTGATEDCLDLAPKCDLQFLKYFGGTSAACPALTENAGDWAQCLKDVGCPLDLGRCFDTSESCPFACPRGSFSVEPAGTHDFGAYAGCDAKAFFTCWGNGLEEYNGCTEIKSLLLVTLKCAEQHNCPIEDVRAGAFTFDCNFKDNDEQLAAACGGATCAQIAAEAFPPTTSPTAAPTPPTKSPTMVPTTAPTLPTKSPTRSPTKSPAASLSTPDSGGTPTSANVVMAAVATAALVLA